MRTRRSLHRRAASAALSLPFVFCLVGEAQEAPCAAIDLAREAPELVDHPRGSDIACLRRWVDLEQSWPGGARDRALRKIDALKANREMSTTEFILGFSEVTALADNGHSNTSISVIHKIFPLVGIRTLWLDDGLFVVRVRGELEPLLGARIESIGGRAPEDLVAVVSRHMGGTDALIKAYHHAPFLLSPRLLNATGVTPDPKVARFTFSLPSGERIERDLTAPSADGQPRVRYWRFMVPEPIEGEGEAWRAVLDASSSADRPWALQSPDTPFRYRFLSEPRVAHIQLRANIDTGGARIKSFLRDTKKRLKQDRPRHVILDNRWNGGGDLTLTADFVIDLADLLPPEGRVFSLTTGATFSAGIYSAFLPKATHPDRTVVIGTRVGDRERFWAETGPRLALPQLDFPIGYSLEMHDLGAGCHDRSICHIRNPRWNVAVGSFDPDVHVPLRAADLFAGRDAHVEHVLDAVKPNAE